MSDKTHHHFEPASQFCLGCDISAREVADNSGVKPKRGQRVDTRIASCPAVYSVINDERMGMLSVIASFDRLVVTQNGVILLNLGSHGAVAMIQAASGIAQ